MMWLKMGWSLVKGKLNPFGLLVAPFMSYILAAVAAAVITFVGVHLWNDKQVLDRLDVMTNEVAAAGVYADQLDAALTTNRRAVSDCRAINQANVDAYQDQAARGMQAARRIAAQEAMTNSGVSDTVERADELRATNLTCDAITDDFRQWVTQ